MKHYGVVIVFFLLLFTMEAQVVRTVKSLDNPNNIRSYVINPDGILSENAVYEINAKADSLAKQGVATLVVVAVNSIGNDVPDEFANELYKAWGIGMGKTGNGEG